jgi:hypothetical protein
VFFSLVSSSQIFIIIVVSSGKHYCHFGSLHPSLCFRQCILSNISSRRWKTVLESRYNYQDTKHRLSSS